MAGHRKDIYGGNRRDGSYREHTAVETYENIAVGRNRADTGAFSIYARMGTAEPVGSVYLNLFVVGGKITTYA